MIPKQRKPTHPGEVLLTEFLKPLGISQLKLAKRLGVPVQWINTLINGKRGVTAGTAVLLAKELKTTPEFWMNLQSNEKISPRALGQKEIVSFVAGSA